MGGVPARPMCSIKEYAEKCLQKMPDDFDKQAYEKDKKAYLMEHVKE